MLLPDYFYNTAGTQAGGAGCQESFGIIKGGNSTGRFDTDLRPDIALEKGNIFKRGSARRKACGCLNEICMRLCYQTAHLNFFFLGKQACFDDNFEDDA